jgi:hypothetical protein
MPSGTSIDLSPMTLEAKTTTTWRGTPNEQHDLLAAVQSH